MVPSISQCTSSGHYMHIMLKPNASDSKYTEHQWVCWKSDCKRGILEPDKHSDSHTNKKFHQAMQSLLSGSQLVGGPVLRTFERKHDCPDKDRAAIVRNVQQILKRVNTPNALPLPANPSGVVGDLRKYPREMHRLMLEHLDYDSLRKAWATDSKKQDKDLTAEYKARFIELKLNITNALNTIQDSAADVRYAKYSVWNGLPEKIRHEPQVLDAFLCKWPLAKFQTDCTISDTDQAFENFKQFLVQLDVPWSTEIVKKLIGAISHCTMEERQFAEEPELSLKHMENTFGEHMIVLFTKLNEMRMGDEYSHNADILKCIESCFEQFKIRANLPVDDPENPVNLDIDHSDIDLSRFTAPDASASNQHGRHYLINPKLNTKTTRKCLNQVLGNTLVKGIDLVSELCRMCHSVTLENPWSMTFDPKQKRFKVKCINLTCAQLWTLMVAETKAPVLQCNKAYYDKIQDDTLTFNHLVEMFYDRKWTKKYITDSLNDTNNLKALASIHMLADPAQALIEKCKNHNASKVVDDMVKQSGWVKFFREHFMDRDIQLYELQPGDKLSEAEREERWGIIHFIVIQAIQRLQFLTDSNDNLDQKVNNFFTNGIETAKERIELITNHEWDKLPKKFLRNRLSACAWLSLVHVFQRQDDSSQDYTLPLVLHGVNAYKFYKLANALFGEKDDTHDKSPWWLQRSCLNMEGCSFERKTLCITLTHPKYLKKLVQKGACINLMALNSDSMKKSLLTQVNQLTGTTRMLCRRFFKEHDVDIQRNPKQIVELTDTGKVININLNFEDGLPMKAIDLINMSEVNKRNQDIWRGLSEEFITLAIKAHNPNSEGNVVTLLRLNMLPPRRLQQCFHKIRGENPTLYDSYIKDIDEFVKRLRCC